MARPLVVSRPGTRPAWADSLDGALFEVPDTLPDADLGDINSVWIDAADVKPLELARRVTAGDPSLQTVVVAPPEDIGIHQRALLFTPGLGEVWIMTSEDVDEEVLERASEVTATRRRYQDRRGELNSALQSFSGSRPRRAIVSDAYLAALLQVLPDPVVSVDDEGRVVSWSDAAGRLFGKAPTEVLGRPVVQVLGPDEPASLHDALDRSRGGTTRLELVARGTDGPLVMETSITPVEAGGVGVRAMILRDVTPERESLARVEKELELRSRFYAAMSHEIRTPINSIIGYNELMRSGAGDESKRDLYLERSNKAAQHLLELVNDVLDLSKLESGGLELQPELVRIDQVLQDLASTLDPIAKEKETPLQVHCDPDPPEIETDPRRLKQILMNLASNALKFGEQRPVRVSCHRDDGRLRVDVEDEGRGIEKGDLERIFEEFVQVGESGEGTGLGLPISRKLAELLGGTLTVESEPGKGSTFRVLLPLHPPRGVAGPQSDGPESDAAPSDGSA